MSALVPEGCAENGDCPERNKGRGKNSVIHGPGDDCAKERHDGEPNKAAY
jgi:hypothetical protein